MTKRQERLILWLLVFNAFMMLVAPVGGASIVQAVSAVFANRQPH